MFSYRVSLLLLLVLSVTGHAQNTSWVGKVILLKTGGERKIARRDDDGAIVFEAKLTGIAYIVVDEDGVWIRLRGNGEEGWLRKREVVLLEDAVTHFTAQIERKEDLAWAYAHRGTAWAVKGELDIALKDFDDAIRLSPDRALCWTLRGNAWRVKKEYDKAIRDYSESIRLDPKDARAFNYRGFTWSEKKEHDKAIRDYSEAIRLDPKFAAAFLTRGNAWRDKKEYDKAIRDYSEAIRLDPKLAAAFFNRGNTWSERKEYDKAIRDYGEAIRLDPRAVAAFLERGKAWHNKKEYGKAIQDFDEAIRLEPKFAHPRGRLAAVQAKKGQYAEAAKGFDEAMRLDPWLPWLQRDYAAFRAACPDAAYRDGRRALLFAVSAIELAGVDADWSYFAALAAARAEVGDFDRAVAEQKKALADKSLDREDREKMEARLKLYEAKKPYRDE
jgi:tetratricopeptide (TPR) repeat protein